MERLNPHFTKITQTGILLCFLTTTSWAASDSPAARKSADYMARRMDQHHRDYAVYTEANSGGNHFVVYPRMSSAYHVTPMLTNLAEEMAPPMRFDFPVDFNNRDKDGHGLTCIRAIFRPKEIDDTFHWAGWYFMLGLLVGTNTEPNWGPIAESGINLSDAVELTGDVRGGIGGEKIEIFAFGVGWSAPPKPTRSQRKELFPDASEKIYPKEADANGYITLKRNWNTYHFALKGRNLTNVLGGFGWAASTAHNKSHEEIEFFLDNVVYRLSEPGRKRRLAEPRLIASFETERSERKFDTVMANVAFVYDNAAALLAFVAVGEMERARILADALVAMVEHDRFHTNGQIRNAGPSGDLYQPLHWRANGRSPVVRMPGWWDEKRNSTSEDLFGVSTHTGNVAWTILALLGYYESVPVKDNAVRHLNAAIRLAEWVVNQTRSTETFGGYYGGFNGWEPNQTRITYRATEHNIDLYPVFSRLARLTGNPTWIQHAEHAKKFVFSMWDETEGKFWTGTGEGTNSSAVNTDFIPLDVQAWAVLAFANGASETPANWQHRCIRFAEQRCTAGEGFSFMVTTNLSKKAAGVWFEGTAQMALAYRQRQENVKAEKLLAFMRKMQAKTDGAMVATDQDQLETGIPLPILPDVDRTTLAEDEQWWFYFKRRHIGATAWFILAETGLNPFWPFEH